MVHSVPNNKFRLVYTVEFSNPGQNHSPMLTASLFHNSFSFNINLCFLALATEG